MCEHRVEDRRNKTNAKKEIWSKDNVFELKKSIRVLIDAAGGEKTTEARPKSTLQDMIQDFVVGTEKRKDQRKKTHIPPKPSELGPIEGILFESSAKRAIEVMHQQKTRSVK